MLGAATIAPGSASGTNWPAEPMLAKIRESAVAFSVSIHLVRVVLNCARIAGKREARRNARIRTDFMVISQFFGPADNNFEGKRRL